MSEIKPLIWVGTSKKDLLALPDPVVHEVGYALHLAQTGKQSPTSKPFTGFGGAYVLGVCEDYQTDTYRAVYTVKFPNAIYVLHCFQKKSKSGISTPKPDIDKIRERLKIAEKHFKEQTK